MAIVNAQNRQIFQNILQAKQEIFAKGGYPYCGTVALWQCGTVGGVFRWRGYGGDARQKFRGGGKAVAAWGRARSLRRNGRKICGGWNGA